MPWGSTSGRTAPLPSNWSDLRRQVKARAHGRCQWVKADGTRCKAWGTDCDHIDGATDHSLANLRWLCAYHHGRRTSEQGNQAQAEIRAKATRPKRQHPGLR